MPKKKNSGLDYLSELRQHIKVYLESPKDTAPFSVDLWEHDRNFREAAQFLLNFHRHAAQKYSLLDFAKAYALERENFRKAHK